MGITDGLLAWGAEYPLGDAGMACLRANALAIEMAHEDELGAARAEVEREHEGWVPPERLAERYVALPVYADGEPMRLGDEVEVSDWPGVPCVIRGIWLGGTPWTLRIVQRDHEDEPGYGEVHLPWPDNRAGTDVRHVTWPTVEGLLADMLKHFGAIDEVTPAVAGYVADYAKRLRLAGDAA